MYIYIYLKVVTKIMGSKEELDLILTSVTQSQVIHLEFPPTWCQLLIVEVAVCAAV